MAAPCGGSACCRVLPLLMTSCFSRLHKRAKPAARRQWDIFRVVRCNWSGSGCCCADQHEVTPSNDSLSAVKLGRLTTAARSARRADQRHLLCDHHMPYTPVSLYQSMTTYTPFSMPHGGACQAVKRTVFRCHWCKQNLGICVCCSCMHPGGDQPARASCMSDKQKARGSCFKWNGGALHGH